MCEYSGLILTNLVRDEFVVVAVIVAVVRLPTMTLDYVQFRDLVTSRLIDLMIRF